MSVNNRVLAINPGSTSTKIAVFDGDKVAFLKNIKHSVEDLAPFENITAQYEFRKNIILQELKDADIDINSIAAVVGRGGLIKPVPSGVFEVNESLKRDLINSPMGEHASNLGGLIADDLAKEIKGARAFIADPVVVDELEELARISGHPLFKRISIFHALNHKAIARKHAKIVSGKYEDMNLIIVHLGGGISIGAHRKGRVIDVNQALDGEGPFSPERSGTLPTGDLVNMCFSGKHTKDQVKKMIKGAGGLVAHLGTNDAYKVELKVLDGDKKNTLVYEAMGYQISKYIGSMAVVLKGEVDAILITGGMGRSEWLVEKIKERVEFIAPVHVYPGEDEMEALALNGNMVLNGEINISEYK